MAEHESPTCDIVGDVEEEHAEDTGEIGDNQTIANQPMKNTGVLAALQDKLCSSVALPAGYLTKLPKAVKRRIKALKKLQNDVINIEADFYKEVKSLELKYASLYMEKFEKRRDILLGKKEPTDEECNWLSDSDEDENDKGEVHKLTEDLKEKVSVKAGGDAAKQSEVSGVPNFWLTVFKNVHFLSDMVKVYDEPILVHLQDIKAVLHSKDPPGFTLEFHFEPNVYFTNSVLTKSYEMRYEPDSLDPLMYEGPEIVKSDGCTIQWNEGKNVTVTQIKKTQKHKFRGDIRTISKQVQADSFFNFFNPPTVPEGESEWETDEEIEALLGVDFDIGNFIRERIVPKAVLYFTGEAIDSKNYDEENEDDDDDDDYEDEDAEYNPGAASKPTECKQQ